MAQQITGYVRRRLRPSFAVRGYTGDVMDMHTDELTQLIQQRLSKPADVFWAIRDVKGKLTKGYWYRIWQDQSRTHWVSFGYLGETYADARRQIMRMN